MPSTLADNERTSLLRNEPPKFDNNYGSASEAPADEEAANQSTEPSSTYVEFDARSQWKKNGVLLLVAFLVNADSSMLYAIFRQVASEFNELESASWIITGHIIGTIVSQPLFGKLSDIYGRKAMLIFACSCAATGGIIAGIGFSFSGVIFGRVISGIANAGMSVLVSTIIVDIVPFQQIAMWRSIVYASNQIGRSAGLPIGGVITDVTNWRWALLFQVPLYLFVIFHIWTKMTFPPPRTDDDSYDTVDSSRMSKIKRIDFSGAISLGLANLSLLLCLDQAPRNLDILKNLFAIIPLGTWITFLVIFISIEAYWAPEPILPLRLLSNRNVLSAYAVQFFQGAVQTGFLTTIPLYFRVTKSASNFQVSIRLLFLSIGSMCGTIFSGTFITKTGRYRRLIQIMQLVSVCTFTTIFLRWRGSTSWLETAYAFPAGMGFSVALSATFIALTDRLQRSQTAVATSGFYLCLNLGGNTGVGVANLITQAVVRQRLVRDLASEPNWRQLIHDITSNINNLDRLPKRIRRVAVGAYTVALVDVWLLFLICACLSFLASLLLKKEQSQYTKGKKPLLIESLDEDETSS